MSVLACDAKSCVTLTTSSSCAVNSRNIATITCHAHIGSPSRAGLTVLYNAYLTPFTSKIRLTSAHYVARNFRACPIIETTTWRTFCNCTISTGKIGSTLACIAAIIPIDTCSIILTRTECITRQN